MTKRMLIDSTHAEETRVVVLYGNRLEDYDVETSTKQQLKGNIYLAKIVRVEPSLQAAFVEFGGGRHGFLAFGEIHPDYYQIPVADRKRLLELQEAEAREEEEEEEREAARRERGGPRAPARREDEGGEGETPELHDDVAADPESPSGDDGAGQDGGAPADLMTEAAYAVAADPEGAETALPHLDALPGQVAQPAAIAQDILVVPEQAQALFPTEGADLALEASEPFAPHPEPQAETVAGTHHEPGAAEPEGDLPHAAADPDHDDTRGDPEAEAKPDAPSDPMAQEASSIETIAAEPAPEHIGGELDTDDRADRRPPSRFMRNYKIQEVMRRRQILLVQVVKEERGNKGAALTTYISLAGRFSVLMPNSPRGGGISRKITSAADRRRLKEITTELDLPRGMGLIVRTAGAQRPKPEIIRDCEYLLDQWDQIRDLTMKSMAPTLIYEEASLIKRAIRDVYSREVEEILVDGEAGWQAARDFMRMLMPSHAKKVQLWRDPQPLFAKAQVESQLDAMLQPTVQLRSGGYLVINQTEALVAIDVNSGRSTRERGIEETALRTNMEAAEEAARQLRLRDLAGLIVIDFIDMESRRNNASVEKKLKDALKNDRARIQVGSISHFGLLEMSRQRLRPSLTETSFVLCPHCGGTGHMRSTESAALAVLRGIEDEGSKRRAAEIVVHVHGSIALYVLNHKRVRLAEIEERFGMHVTFQADDMMIPPAMRIEKVRALVGSEGPVPISQLPPPEPFEDPDEEVLEADPVPEETEPVAAEPRRAEHERRPRREREPRARPSVAAPEADAELGAEPGSAVAGPDDEAERPGETAESGEQQQRKRRRRRRGGRRDDALGSEAGVSAEGAEAAAGGAAEDGAVPEPGMSSGEPEGEGTPTPAGEADGALVAGADGERKRRGRRGGRRRRRDPAEAGEAATGEDEAGADTPEPQPTPPYVPPPVWHSYTGPTPANPFGGDTNAFAFFDAVEEIDDAPPARAPDAVAAKPAPAVAEPVVSVMPEPVVSEPVVSAQGAPEPAASETVAADMVASEPVLAEPVLAKPVLPEPVAAQQVSLEPVVAETAESDPDAPAAEKKKGWWRR